MSLETLYLGMKILLSYLAKSDRSVGLRLDKKIPDNKSWEALKLFFILLLSILRQ